MTLNPIVSEERAGDMLGVPGRFFARTIGGNNYKPGTFTSQTFKATREYQERGARMRMVANVRFDDNCRNGHNTFAITCDIDEWSRGAWRESGGGAAHEEIAKRFPELAPLIKWHLTSSDGPMHYVANAVYHAGDRDHNGLRAGETRPLIHGRTRRPVWELVAINSLGVAISTTPTGLEYQGAESVPLFILTKDCDGETPPATPKLEWRHKLITGEGKARDLAAARSAAVWPDATDAELMAEPAELREALERRLPALLESFRADIERAGFVWAPPAS